VSPSPVVIIGHRGSSIALQILFLAEIHPARSERTVARSGRDAWGVLAFRQGRLPLICRHQRDQGVDRHSARRYRERIAEGSVCWIHSAPSGLSMTRPSRHEFLSRRNVSGPVQQRFDGGVGPADVVSTTGSNREFIDRLLNQSAKDVP
jgi:hypothetical protein